MAIQYPSYAIPKGYDSSFSDVIDSFDKGFAAARKHRDEAAAGDLIRQLYGLDQTAPNKVHPGAEGIGALADMRRRGDLVDDSHAAVAGATDLTLLDELGRHLGGGGASDGGLGDGRTRVASADPMSGYMASVQQAESGGDPNARNPRSSAGGLFQFTDPTWNGLVERYGREHGLTVEGKMDPAQQQTAMRLFTGDNAKALRTEGVAITPGSLYASHFLGAGAAPRVLTADPSTPMTALVGPEVIRANPTLADMTAGEFKEWAGRKGTNANNGYSAPAANAMPSRGMPKISGELMGALFANTATRPLAQAIMAQQLSGKGVEQWQSFTGPDGKAYQVNLANGKVDAIGGGQTINVGGDNQYDKTMGENLAKGFIATQEESANGTRTLTSLQAMEAAMADPNFYSGFGAEPLLGAKRLVSALGLAPEAATSTEAFNSLSKQAALEAMGGSLGAGFSNADRDFVLEQVPTLGNTEGGNRKMIEIHRALAQRKVDIGRLAKRYADAHDGRLDSGWGTYLADWAEANPLFQQADNAQGSGGTTLPDPFGMR